MNKEQAQEIITGLRLCSNEEYFCDTSCHGYGKDECRTDLMKGAADRLESQEQTIAGKDVEISTLKEKVEVLENDAINYDMNLSEMTARAESAERERDAFIDKIRGRCSECEYEPLTSIDEPCVSCHTKNGYPEWKWRGLPQDGGGNER